MKRMYCDRCKNLISSGYPQTLHLIADNVRGDKVNIDLCNACYKELDAWFEKPYRDDADDECQSGYWDFNGYTHYCSCCGKDAEIDENGMEILDDYCPHCKAEMVEQ